MRLLIDSRHPLPRSRNSRGHVCRVLWSSSRLDIPDRLKDRHSNDELESHTRREWEITGGDYLGKANERTSKTLKCNRRLANLRVYHDYFPSLDINSEIIRDKWKISLLFPRTDWKVIKLDYPASPRGALPRSNLVPFRSGKMDFMVARGVQERLTRWLTDWYRTFHRSVRVLIHSRQSEPK